MIVWISGIKDLQPNQIVKADFWSDPNDPDFDPPDVTDHPFRIIRKATRAEFIAERGYDVDSDETVEFYEVSTD